MYGWRARIGAIVPSTNTAVEMEFNTMKPAGVSVHASRMVSLENSVDVLVKLAEDTERASYELGTTMCNAIVYACTSGSFVNGPEWEKTLVERMEKASGTKAVTTSGAVVKALNALGVNKISVTTPYEDEVNSRWISYLKYYGKEVVSLDTLRITNNYLGGQTHPETIYRLAKSIVRPETEALVLSCTDMRSIEVIEMLETDFHIPVISSNQASFWAALRMADVNEHLRGYGSLFDLS